MIDNVIFVDINLVHDAHWCIPRCLRISAGDMPGYDISQHFQDTWVFIEEARKAKAKILVHCVAGASRSSTVVIAYLMQL